MGACFVAPQMGIEIAETFLNHNLGDGYEKWGGYYEFHKLAYDELEAFDYETFKANGFEVFKSGEVVVDPKPIGF
jgi:ribose 5-phosphate isomerase B